LANQPTSRPEPEALHRSMMQASAHVAALDQRVEEERRRDGLGPFLETWRKAAAGARSVLSKVRGDLVGHGAAHEHLQRIGLRLDRLRRRAAEFHVGVDFDECARSWADLAHDVAALPGPGRDELMRFLAGRKEEVDRATTGLAQARAAGGMHPEQRARVRAVEQERDRAREAYAELRDDYLRATRAHPGLRPAPPVAPIVLKLPEPPGARAAVRAAPPRLDALIERERHLRVGIAQRFEKTLGSLATSEHRKLADPRAGELRGHLARMDGILARLQGKRSAAELSEAARQIGGVLAEMGDIAAGRATDVGLKPFRALLEERRAALARVAGEAQQAAGAQALHQRGALPQPSAAALGEHQLQMLRKLHPGVEKLLRDASASQLAAQLHRPETQSPLERAHALSAPSGAGLGGAVAGARLLGGLGALGEHAAIGRALAMPQAKPSARAVELHELLGASIRPPHAAPLHQVALHAERKLLAERAKARLHAAPPTQALAEAFRARGRSAFAAHVAPGGALYQVLQAAQRSQGLPIPQFASHYLQSRGAHPLLGTVQLFERLRAQGHRPHFGLFSRLKHAAGDAIHKATSAVSRKVDDVARTATSLSKAAAGTVRRGISDLGHAARDAGHQVADAVHAAAGTVGRGVRGSAQAVGRAVAQAAHGVGRGASALAHAAGRSASRVTRTVRDVVHRGIDRATQLGAAVAQRAGEAAHEAGRFGRQVVHKGLDALHRTGIAGGIGKGIRFGLSAVKAAAKSSPIGLAVQGFHEAGGLQGIWEKTKHTAAAAWHGVQKAYGATSHFLQSPAGQLLVTGLSLAATFVPGGVVVKGLVGGAIGAIQAISEGKDWKRVLLAAGTGALTGALPFLKLGPLATVGIGALSGAASTLASGGSLKDAVKGAATGAIDSFNPGALKALGRLKSLKAARKMVPVRQLAKLEKTASKGVRGGIWLSGKATKAQGYLDKALAMGDRLEGGLALIHKLAPEVAGVVGDNALGQLIAQAGDYAGRGDHRLKQALDMGHGASDRMHRYRGHLDKSLGYAGVKDPRAAYGRMMARKAAREGKREGIEAVAQEKLARHRQRHPELQEALRAPRVQGTVAKGTGYGEHVETGLAKAAALARQGAGVLGEESELGAYLSHLADRADRAHGWVEQGVDFVRDFNERVGKVEGGLEEIPGVRPEGAPKPRKKKIDDAPEPVHVRHGVSEVHAPAAAHESPEERSQRLSRAWNAIGRVSSQVQRFESESAQRLRKVHELTAQGRTQEASSELMGLGSHVDDIAKRIREARRLAQGNEKYEKEIAFYEEWQQKARETVHAAIAGGKDLGRHVGVSGQGISEATHPDVFRNTREIFAVQTKVIAFGGALSDADARPHVEMVLAEAKAVKAELRSLQAKYRRDAAARAFLGDGEQDRLIDESIARLGKALKPEHPPAAAPAEPGPARAPRKAPDHGLAAAAGKKGVHQGRKLLEEALHLGAAQHVEQHHRANAPGSERHAPRGEARETHPAHESEPAAPHREHEAVAHLDAHAAVAAAAEAVARFGSVVEAASKDLHGLVERNRGAEAAARIRSVEGVAAEAKVAVAAAAQAASGDPAQTAHVVALRKHLEEIRAHFRQLVGGLHGLEAAEATADAKDAAGPVARRGQRPSRGRGARDQGHLVDEVLRGIDEGRIFVDREAHRGERPAHENQDVDGGAVDTWIGSGEGVKLFSEVFGPFIPGEAAARRAARHQRRRARRPQAGGGGGGAHRDHKGHAEPEAPAREQRNGKGGFFARVFEKVEDFAEGVAHVAHAGKRIVGKAMHYAETGMHGLNVVEHAAERVHDFADRAESFLYRIHLGSAAEIAHRVGGAAGWVDERAKTAHEGLKTADEVLGEGKEDLEAVESHSHRAAKVVHKARKGHFGEVLQLFRAATDGDGTDGALRPEQVRLGSSLDEPRRLDALTQARMQQFLGGDFSGVRVHVGPGAAQITQRYAAEAVTVSDHIFFAPGKFSPTSLEGEKLLAHELTHVLQKGRHNLDVRTAESEALQAEHTYGTAPAMEPLNLRRPTPDFKLPDGEGAPGSDGIHTAKRTRSRGHDAAGKDELPQGEEFLEKVSGRVYELLMEELEQAFESR